MRDGTRFLRYVAFLLAIAVEVMALEQRGMAYAAQLGWSVQTDTSAWPQDEGRNKYTSSPAL